MLRIVCVTLLVFAACTPEHTGRDNGVLFTLLSVRYYGPRYLFVGTGSPSSAISYGVGMDGRLAESSRVTAGNFPVAFAFDSRLRFIHMGSTSGGGYISSLAFNRSTGQLSVISDPILGSAVATFDHPRYYYTINVIATQINVYPSNSDGTVGASVAYDTAQSFGGGRMAADGLFYLSNNAAAGSVRSYRLEPNGVVTTIQSVNSSATNQNNVGLHPSGRLLYVANNSATNQIGIYTLDGAGSIAGPAYTTIPGGAGQTSFAFDPLGRYLFASRALASGNLQTFAVDQASGALTFLSSITTGTAPSGVLVDPAGRFLFQIDPATSTIRVFTYNNGALTAAPGSPITISGATNPSALSVLMYEHYPYGTIDFN